MSKRFSPSADRNRGPILEVLQRVLPESGHVLEIASGSGQHVVHFASALPELTFQPTDPSLEARASIDALRSESGLENVLPARAVDVLLPGWERSAGLAVVDAVLCINMIHVAPWQAAEELFAGASRILSSGAPLVLYGPFQFQGRFLAPSNEEFSRTLEERDPSWGVRDVTDLERLATRSSMTMESPIAMPANNHSIVFRRI